MTDDRGRNPTETCDQVAEQIALGEPVGATDHVASCERCRHTLAVAAAIRARSSARGPADPGPGFAARMTVGTQHKLAVRKRRRIATGLATVVATGALGVVAMTHINNPDADDASEVAGRMVTASVPAVATPDLLPHQEPSPTPPPDHPRIDDDVAAVVELADIADIEHALAPTVDWHGIEAPLAPYHKLIEGVKP